MSRDEFIWHNCVSLQVGIAMSYVLWAMSSTFTIFVIARIIAGMSKGNISLSTAIVADVSTPEKRGKGMVGCYNLYMKLRR